jgi:hypothetical protein
MATDPTRMLEDLYRAFNQRDADGVLANLGPGVEWPNAETGGTVTGHDALRAYLAALWQRTDVIMEPVRIDSDAAGRARVRVDQLVRDRGGKVLDHAQFEQTFTFSGPFISRMVSTRLAKEPDEDEE